MEIKRKKKSAVSFHLTRAENFIDKKKISLKLVLWNNFMVSLNLNPAGHFLFFNGIQLYRDLLCYFHLPFTVVCPLLSLSLHLIRYPVKCYNTYRSRALLCTLKWTLSRKTVLLLYFTLNPDVSVQAAQMINTNIYFTFAISLI